MLSPEELQSELFSVKFTPTKPKKQESSFNLFDLIGDISDSARTFADAGIVKPLHDLQQIEYDRETRTIKKPNPVVQNVAAFLEGVANPQATRDLRYEVKNPVGKVALAAGEFLPGVGSALDATFKGDPLEGTGAGMARDIARTLGELIVPAVGVAKGAQLAGKTMGTGKTIATAAALSGAQELKNRGITDPVGSAANIGIAAAGGAALGRMSDPFISKGATALNRLGRAVAAETGIEAVTGVPAAVVNVSDILSRASKGEELTEEDRKQLRSELIMSGVSALAGGVIGGLSARSDTNVTEKAAAQKKANREELLRISLGDDYTPDLSNEQVFRIVREQEARKLGYNDDAEYMDSVAYEAMTPEERIEFDRDFAEKALAAENAKLDEVFREQAEEGRRLREAEDETEFIRRQIEDERQQQAGRDAERFEEASKQFDRRRESVFEEVRADDVRKQRARDETEFIRRQIEDQERVRAKAGKELAGRQAEEFSRASRQFDQRGDDAIEQIRAEERAAADAVRETEAIRRDAETIAASDAERQRMVEERGPRPVGEPVDVAALEAAKARQGTPEGESPFMFTEAGASRDPLNLGKQIKLEGMVSDIARRALGNDMPVKTVVADIVTNAHGNAVAGRYSPFEKVVTVSGRADDPLGAAHHEVFHAARDLVLSERQRKALDDRFRVDSPYYKRTLDLIEKDERLTDLERDRIKAAINTNPLEAQNYAYQYIAENRFKPDGVINQIIDEFKQFYEALSNKIASIRDNDAELGFYSTLDIMRSLQDGTLSSKGRPRSRVYMPGVKAAGEAMREGIVKMQRMAADNSLGNVSKVAGVPIPSKAAMARVGSKAVRTLAPKGMAEGAEFARLEDVLQGKLQDAAFNRLNKVRALRSALKNATEEQLEQGYRMLIGDNDSVDALTENQLKLIREAREEVDQLSAYVISRGIPSEVVGQTIKDNIGRYVTRFYKIDVDPNYHKTVQRTKPEVYEAAVDYFVREEQLRRAGFDLENAAPEVRQGDPTFETKSERKKKMFRTMAVEEAISLARGEQSSQSILSAENAEIARKAGEIDITPEIRAAAKAKVDEMLQMRGLKGNFKARAKRGIETNRFMGRKRIPKEIMELYGEVRNPIAAFDKTIHDLSSIIAKHDFFLELSMSKRADGTKYAYDANDPERYRVGATWKVSDIGPEPHRLGAMSNKYVTKEIYEALNDFVPGEANALTNFAAAVARPFQMAQTVLSPVTHMRNMLSNASYHATLANISPLNPKNAKYYKQALAMMIEPDSRRGTNLAKVGFKAVGRDTAAFREAVEAGALAKQFWDQPGSEEILKNSSTLLNEYAKALNPNTPKTLTDVLKGGWQKALGIKDNLTSMYIAEDQIFRLASYLKQRDLGYSPREAAEWGNHFFPDYSRIARGIKAIQDTPFAAPFLSYAADLPRSFANGWIYNPGKSALLMTSLISAMGAIPTIVSEEEKANWDQASNLLPSYYRNAINMPIKAGGKFMFVNMNTFFPIASVATMAQSAKGMLSNDRPLATDELLLSGPFMDGLMILASRRNARGQQVVPDDANAMEHIQTMFQEMMRSYIPPPVPPVWSGVPGLRDVMPEKGGYEAERFIKAVSQEPGKYGQRQNLSHAIIGLTGIRPQEIQWDAALNMRTIEATNSFGFRYRDMKRKADAPGLSSRDRELIKRESKELWQQVEEFRQQMSDAYRAGLKLDRNLTDQAKKNTQDSFQRLRRIQTQLANLSNAM